MKARVAGIAGSVLALTVIGGFAAASTFQSAPAPAPVVVATVAPTETPTVEPVVVPTTQAPVVKAPAPVESTQAPVQVAPTSEAPVAVKSPAPAPVVAAPVPAFKQPGVGATKPPGGWSTVAGKYPDGTPLQYDVIGNVIPFAAP